MKIKTLPRMVLGCSMIAGCALATISQSAQAEAVPTTLGEKGLPPIWLQGEPVKKFKKDHLYIFEFWATWCAPCIAQMPHLEELHQHFKDDKSVTIIGVNVMDPTPVDKIKNFLKSKKVTYSMAADGSRKGPVVKMWLDPLGVEGIPHAIALRNGEILWRGHAASLSKDLITKMDDPNFSNEKLKKFAATKEEKRKQLQEEYFAVISQLDTLNADESLALIEEYMKNPDTPEISKVKALWQMFKINFKKGQDDAAQKALMALSEKMPDNDLAQFTVGATIVCTDDLENKNLELAIKSLERSAELKPARAEICFKHIADAKLMLGDRQGAIEASEKAVLASRSYKKLDALKSTLTK